jgi:hypothetical protein
MKNLFLVMIMVLGLVLSSCSNDDNNTQQATADLVLNLLGLEDLGSNYVYEGWIIVNGAPVSTGTFSSVNFPQSFALDTDDLVNASTFVLTIEPAGETGNDALTPSNTKIMAGDFSGNTATVNTEIIGDFSSISGQFIMATPTDNIGGVDNMNNENGIWWLDPTSGTPVAGLDLPMIPEGWKYEGWVVANGTPLTTGTFTNVAATDDAAPFSGPEPLPMANGADGFFPGEDFVANAPAGMTFPLDVRNMTAVISIEPYPDNSPNPFLLKPLVGTAGMMTAPALNNMDSNVMGSFPTGSVSR